MQPVYFHESSAISAQNSHQEPLLVPLQPPQEGRYAAIAPNYQQYLPVMRTRRMNRMLKMALFAGLDCCSRAKGSPPEGIITGTSRGNLSGTEQFLKDLIRYEEESLNPTPFIFSTYNMINGAIALEKGIEGYNQTFVHQGSSFELALLDAQLYLHEKNKPGALLVGCYDELTDDYFIIKNKPAWREGNGSGASPVAAAVPAVVGEGATFFMLRTEEEDAVASLKKVRVFGSPAFGDIRETLLRDLRDIDWTIGEIDGLVLGVTDAAEADPYYASLLSLFPNEVPVLSFKHLCGEYECAGAFGIWLLLQHFSGRPLPSGVWSAPLRDTGSNKKILYYNHFGSINHNFLFVEAPSRR